MMEANVVRGELRLAPNVVFTQLPFGGGVLLNSHTLALAECNEGDAGIVSRLLAGDRADMRMTGQLLEAGWLTAVPEQR